ncbi:hypothetical protein [Halothiobacillus sp. 15-55-196]|jgi:hypothetical protein|uniref:hypothetical protein n=1 Tax=Halothiobacillus sp. 15-55-196 TaxID=1970382 RepID=UPI0025B9AB68|nr:hypothetical protein [Halothiobacillus sp. 15-55-196]
MSTTPSTESIKSAAESESTFSGLDGESRNREVTRTLLRLRGESLMKAVAAGSKVLGVRLDYGNASAWMREIPGRFGQKKQDELLSYLGVEQHRLTAGRIHVWALPPHTDLERAKAMLDLLATYAGQPDRFAWLKTPSDALRGLALMAGGVSIVFLPTSETNHEDMTQWLVQFGLKDKQDVSSEVGVISDEIWTQLLDHQLSPGSLWLTSGPSAEQDWRPVIEWAKQNGLGPEETLRRLQAASFTEVADFHTPLESF